MEGEGGFRKWPHSVNVTIIGRERAVRIRVGAQQNRAPPKHLKAATGPAGRLQRVRFPYTPEVRDCAIP